jgi:hypothetical protein
MNVPKKSEPKSSKKRTLVYEGPGTQFVCSDGTIVPRGGQLEVSDSEADSLLAGPIEFSEPQAEVGEGHKEEEGS